MKKDEGKERPRLWLDRRPAPHTHGVPDDLDIEDHGERKEEGRNPPQGKGRIPTLTLRVIRTMVPGVKSII